MAKQTNKRQKALKREQSKRKRINKMERQDAVGLSRKKFSFTIKPKTFFTMKIIGIILIPAAYFIYSPFLVLVMIYYVLLFFTAIGCEHSLNKSVIKSNHIKIPKYDSAIALTLIAISFFGSAFGVSAGRVGMFANTLWMKFVTALTNFGSLLTGSRTIFGPVKKFGFGMAEKPEGFMPNREAFEEFLGDMPPGEFGGGGRPHFEISMDNIPVEFMFSQLLSTVNTVLIFSVAIFGILSLVVTYRKIHRFEEDINEVITDGEIAFLSDEEMSKILDFGEQIEYFEAR
ncbi:MAG: hypothetical protein AB7S88_01510 [Candidatus Izemoplasmatales bacterium]